MQQTFAFDQLRTIAETASRRLARIYDLYELGTPPTITPGMVDAILEAAEERHIPDHTCEITLPQPTTTVYANDKRPAPVEDVPKIDRRRLPKSPEVIAKMNAARAAKRAARLAEQEAAAPAQEAAFRHGAEPRA